MKKLLVIGSQILILAGCSGNDAADPARDIAQAPASPALSTFQVPDEPQIQSEPQGPSALPEPSALTPISGETEPTADFSAPQHDSQLVVGGPEPKPATPIETLAPQIRALQSDLTGFLSLDSGGLGDDRPLRELVPTVDALVKQLEQSGSDSAQLESQFVKLQADFFTKIAQFRQQLAAADQAPRSYVVPIFWNRLSAFTKPSEAATRTRVIAANATKYLIGPSYGGTYRTYAADGYLDLGGGNENNIRYPAMTALSFAVNLKTGIYDEKTLSAENALKRAHNLIRTISAKHKANGNQDASRWGDVWQSALWAYYNGFAAWLLWDKLDALEQDHTVNMIVSEANRFLTGNDLYLIGRSGHKLYATVLTENKEDQRDTKAEENQWSAALLGLAVTMMPEHPNAKQWAKRHRELLVSAVAHKSDLTSDEVVNGIQLKTWLRGTNIAENGTVYNHEIKHPIYMLVDQGLYEAVVSGLAKQCAPVAAKRHVPLIYRALVDVKHKWNSNAIGLPKEVLATSSEFTIYQPNSAQIFYPEGNDWGTQFSGYFGSFDQLISVFKLDTQVSTPAHVWEALHSTAQLALQNRTGDGRVVDGHTYDNDIENSYKGREQRIGILYSLTYLATRLVQSDAGDLTCWTND